MIESVNISLTARSKTARYYGPSVIRQKLNELDGVLFRREDGPFYLRTTQPVQNGPPKRVVILFEVGESTAHVLTQTSDHYDWAEFEQVQNPDFCIDLGLDNRSGE